MNKEQILNRLEELEKERAEIVAEQAAIDHVRSLVMSNESSRADEIGHSLARRQQALDARKGAWEAEVSYIERLVA